MDRPVASIERDGLAYCGTTIDLNATEATQITLSVDGVPVAGVEFDADGVGTIGWFPPDRPDTWVELGRFVPVPLTSAIDPAASAWRTGTSVTDAPRFDTNVVGRINGRE